MKKSLLTIVQYLFFFALGIFFVWLAVKEITYKDWQHIKESLAQARHWLIVPVVGMLLVSHYSRAVRWKILMEPLGYNPSLFNTWAAVMIGYMVNAGVPRLGEVVKCTILAKYENVRADKLVGTILVERVIDLISLITVFALALLTQGHIIGDYTFELLNTFITDKSGQTSARKIVITITSVILFFVLVYFLLKRFGHIDAVAKIKIGIKGILHGLSSIRLIRQKGLFLFHSVFIWLLYLLSTTVGLYALRETDHLGIGAGLASLAIGSVGMIITPGGIGAYPLLEAKLMELYGLDFKTTGMAFGWLLWTVQTLIILGGGLIFSSLLSYYNKKRRLRAAASEHNR